MAGNKQASWEVAQNTRRADDHLHTIAFAVLYLYLLLPRKHSPDVASPD